MENTTEKNICKKYHDSLGVGLYHLDPRWCNQYEFDAALDLGMVNMLRLTTEAGSGTFNYGCRVAAERGYQVWYSAPAYIGKTETLSEYMAALKKKIGFIKNAGNWDTVVGFQWDEPLLKKGHSNEDFLTMTKAVWEEYGKRIFPVFSLYEIVGKRGNIGDPDFQWLFSKESSDYITDVGFDVYGYDFRAPLREEKKLKLKKDFGRDFETPEEILQYFTDVTLGLMKKPDDVRFWYFPCAYLCKLYAGGPIADEDFCTASLKGFKELLLKQKNPGGLFAYGFKSWGDRNHLDWQIDEDNPNRWNKYIAAAKDVCDELKDIKIKL